ncbi:hypothetical protein NDU88_002112 [Pleurodeles waltl]|uniref:Uncharacterized protein n=1 Tax=Pleurodeles waltl TaxID=8319 RepID=A0AAV7WRD8_PLEWA|nr:hypothetical protein NDU88_002112 [Pleurodeles waltl]
MPSARRALKTPLGFTRKPLQSRPMRNAFWSTLGSIVCTGMHYGIRAQQRRTRKTDRTHFQQQTTPVDAAISSSPKETILAESLRPQDRRTRRQRQHQCGHALGRAWPSEPHSRGGECDGPITASRPRCPRGTDDSAWLHPEALAEQTNEERLPEHSGLHSMHGDAFWGPGAAEEDEEDQRNPFSPADDSCGCSHQQRPKGDDTGGISVTPGSEDQEVETAPVRPRSGNSVAFAGTVPQRTVLPSKRD